MIFKQYHDIKDFHAAVYPTLLRHEAQNVIPLGNVIMGERGTDTSGWRDPANWFMATVTSGDGGLLLTALMTPPHNLTLYATDNKYDRALLEFFIGKTLDIAFPGIVTEKELAQLFTQIYCEKTGLQHRVETDLRLYELTEVNKELMPDLSADSPYTLRLAEERDMAFLPYWGEAFNLECFGTPITVTAETADAYRAVLTRRKRHILEHNGAPVSMAGITREMVSVASIAAVYTPPYYRGRGYATMCVAAVSQIALDKGFDKCVLYTDLANPTSNSIYMKIGYTPVSDSVKINFTKPE